jgi:heptosyltransferase-2
VQPVILVGPHEEEIASEVTASASPDIPVVGPDVDIAGLAGVMAHLEAAVCNDSGPMHLGAMIGLPIIALFGPTDPSRTAPVGRCHRVISRQLDCAPCLEPRCPLKHNACLHELATETVTEAVLEVVGTGSRDS